MLIQLSINTRLLRRESAPRASEQGRPGEGCSGFSGKLKLESEITPTIPRGVANRHHQGESSQAAERESCDYYDLSYLIIRGTLADGLWRSEDSIANLGHEETFLCGVGVPRFGVTV